MSDNEWRPLNLNDRVRVRLMPLGRLIFRRRRQEINETLPATTEPLPLEPRLDADGLWSTELWHLMQLMGPHISMGSEPPFKIEFEVRRG